MRTQINIIVFFVLVTLVSCDRINIIEEPNEKIVLHYNNNNGMKFCEGEHRVIKKYGIKKKNRTGLWKFYHSDGSLNNLMLYDDEGELLNYKEYRKSGIIKRSQIKSNGEIIYFEYNDIGKIIYENMTTVEVEKIDGEDYETYYETVYKYFDNGQLKSQKSYVNDVAEGQAQIWNEDGNLLIEYTYKEGLIIPK